MGSPRGEAKGGLLTSTLVLEEAIGNLKAPKFREVVNPFPQPSRTLLLCAHTSATTRSKGWSPQPPKPFESWAHSILTMATGEANLRLISSNEDREEMEAFFGERAELPWAFLACCRILTTSRY